jgi:nucleotide-binding universal stress UspA family protein
LISCGPESGIAAAQAGGQEAAMEDGLRITYASDFSPASLAAFSPALRLTKATGGEPTILHVLLSPASMFVAGGYVTQETWDLIEADIRSRAGEEMDRLVKRAAEAGVRATPMFVESGLPAEEIVRAAGQAKTDVLVLGTHGRTGVMKMLLGSVAARVVATAPCPVLTVRMTPAEARP